jgi:transcriptional regulator with XRE-family HTH domain
VTNNQEYFYRLLGERIRMRRRQNALSQAALAELLSLSRTSVANIEAGRQGMTLPAFADLCRHLGVSADELLSGESDEDTTPLGEEFAELHRDDERAFVLRALRGATRERAASN